jgi:transcriptional regulator with PAS, ATPase and Fis domain
MQALTDYAWAGNIRELENFLERAVILTRSDKLYVPLEELRSSGFEPHNVKAEKTSSPKEFINLEEMERPIYRGSSRTYERHNRRQRRCGGNFGSAGFHASQPDEKARNEIEKLCQYGFHKLKAKNRKLG